MHGSYTTFAGIYESNYYTRALYSALGSYTRRYAILCTIIADCQVLYHAQNLMSQMYEVCMQYCTKMTVEKKQNMIGKRSFTHDCRSIDERS